MWIPLFALVLLAVAYWIRQRLSYWKRLGVAYVEPSFPQGNLQGLGKSHHMSQILRDCYVQLKSHGPFGGIYFFINPVALLTNLDLVKTVLVKDFQVFHDRNLYHNERDDPLSGHLVAMEGTKWRNLRAKLTPTFTSGKMKLMFTTVTAVAEEFTACLAREATPPNAPVEMKDLLARFTTDVIGTVAFGLECNSLRDVNARFRVMGRKVFEPSRYRALKSFAASQFPQIARALHVTLTPADISAFFMGVVQDTIRFRRTHADVQRNDFMTLLMKVMEQDVVDATGNKEGGQLTMDDIAAQAFVFFLAGFETSSTTMSFCLYELALHQELQDRARANVDEVLRKHGSISYEAVHEMKYIEMCINESLRKYPPATTLTRKANQAYHVAGTKHVLPEGLMVAIPVYAIHHDPTYYPHPERFDPERFSPEQTARRHPFAFLPFGEGPRVCIGLRFGMMQARIGLVYLLRHFRFTLDGARMSGPLQISPSSPILTIDGGLWLKVEKL